MIDLLINMSEIYGQPNGNSSGRSLTDDDEDDDEHEDDEEEEDINDEREHLHDDEREQHDWNPTSQQNGYEGNSLPVNGSRSGSFVQSKWIDTSLSLTRHRVRGID